MNAVFAGGKTNGIISRKTVADYSSIPLVKKLGIREDSRVSIVNAPRNFAETIGHLPRGASLLDARSRRLDLILLFVKNQEELASQFTRLSAKLKPDGMLWVAWPKKSSQVATDLSFEVVQKHGLRSGLVDTKVCSINDIWSGLKFVFRIKDRTERI